MTNREKYRQAFSALHASDDISLEGNTMKKENLKFSIRPALAACLCVAVMIGCMGVAYAADVGGIRETIEIWFNGRQVEAGVVDYSGDGKGGYAFEINENGETRTVSGGGVAIDENGVESALSPEEVADAFAIDVDVDENGRVWLYHYGQSYDITDLMAHGKCKVSLDNGANPLYFDVEDNGAGGYAFSMSAEPTGSPKDYIGLK